MPDADLEATSVAPSLETYTDRHGRVRLPSPGVASFLFLNVRASWLWLLVRLWLASQWLPAGWHKLTDPAWMDSSGRGIGAFWARSLGTTSTGDPVITFDWYRFVIRVLVDSHAEAWFSKLIVFGELAVGIGLLLGGLVWLFAAGGLLMNLVYLLAGSDSTNPILLVLEVLLLLAWRNAGYIGLDRWLLPALGTLWWRPGHRLTRSVRSRADASARVG